MAPQHIPEVLKPIFSYIDNNKERFIRNLKEAVAIPSVSGSSENRKDVIKMMKWAAEWLKSIGTKVELCDIGEQVLPNGEKLPLPPVILGHLGDDESKSTVCIYGHLDVQPAAKEDGWYTEPFLLTQKNDKLYGRGATDDKGPAISWLHTIEAYQHTNNQLPVNIKFCFEGMEESGSVGLEDLLISKKETFFKNVDFVCISDNYWLGTKKPCLTYGLRGLCYFAIEIACASQDLHSGSYGGSVCEAMSDLIFLLNTLKDKEGKILIHGLMDDVVPLTQEECKIYEQIDFDIDAYKNEIGTAELQHKLKEDILMARWRYPSLSIHGIEGAFSQPGSKTVIPRKVIGKFSIRIVPNQEPKKVEELVVAYLNDQWRQRGSPNIYSSYMMDSGKPWMSDPFHLHYTAAQKATRHVYNIDPDLTREGGSIPITLTLQEVTGKNVLLLPMGCSDDGAHAQNEKIDVRNYIEGTKLFAAYLYEISNLKK